MALLVLRTLNQIMYEKILEILRNKEVLVAAIGPITKKVLDDYGINPVMPSVYTFKDMLDKLQEVMDK